MRTYRYAVAGELNPKNAGTTGYAAVMYKRLGEIGYAGS